MSDWGGLVPDILFMILQRIEEVEDFVSFVSVCSTWRAVRLYEGFTQPLKPLRWLMFRPPKESCRFLEYYNFTKDKIYRVVMRKEITNLKIIATNGWILTLSLKPEMKLIHPFSSYDIPLPAKTANGFYLWDVRKAVLSSSPFLSPNDYSLMIIFSGIYRLAFWKLGDKTWTMIETYNAPFEDIIYRRGQFYAIDKQGVIYVYDIRGCNPTIAVSINKIPSGPRIHGFYLAGRDSLLIVAQVHTFGGVWVAGVTNQTCHFKVYEMNLCGKGVKEVNDLGDRTIFLSKDESVCFEDSKFPPGIVDDDIHCSGLYWCPYSCSVSTHLHEEGIHMRIYDLKNKRRENFFYSLNMMACLSLKFW